MEIKYQWKVLLMNYEEKYIIELKEQLSSLNFSEFKKAIKIIRTFKKNLNKKIIVLGNGGSSAIASHAVVDFLKNNNVNILNFSDHSLLTCYANDFGYQNVFVNILRQHLKKNDLLILVSSSGKSKNIINAINYCKKQNVKLIGFSGFAKNNPLNEKSDIKFWVDSKNYNIIENTHQSWLLMICDKLANKKII